MIKEFNTLKEIKKYYDKKSNTYIFKEDGAYIDLVIFDFNLTVKANINALNIKALNIKAFDIHARDIKANNIIAKDIDVDNIECADIDARNINALDMNSLNISARDLHADNINSRNITAINIDALYINYDMLCIAVQNIKCKSIKSGIENAKHFVLHGTLEIDKNVN